MEHNPQKATKNVILFTAHPDDHAFVSGTMMLLKDNGFHLHEVVATGGEKSVWWSSNNEKKIGFDRSSLAAERKKEITKASQIIGIDRTTFLGLPDSEITRSFELVEKLVGLIRQDQPDIIITMNPKDYHHDHREFGKLVTEAAERASFASQPELGTPSRAPALLYMEGVYFGKPHVFVDVTKYQKRRNELLDAYASQIDVSERRMLDSMNMYRGFFRRDPNVLVGETFEIAKEFPIYLNRIMDALRS